MFDIGFMELLVIAVVGLLVIGPERLPEAIRTGAMWVGRARRTFSRFRQEVEKEIGADEIRRDLRNEAIMEQLEQARSSFKEVASTPLTGDTDNKITGATKNSPDTEKPNG